MISQLYNPNTIVTLSERDVMDLVIKKKVISASVIVALPFWQNNGIDLLLTKESQKNREGNSDIITKLPGGDIKVGENYIQATVREIEEELVAQVAIDSIQFCHAWQARNTNKNSNEKHYKICVIAHNFTLSQELAAKTVDTDIKDRYFKPFLDIITKKEGEPGYIRIPNSQKLFFPFIADKLSRVSPQYATHLMDYTRVHQVDKYK